MYKRQSNKCGLNVQWFSIHINAHLPRNCQGLLGLAYKMKKNSKKSEELRKLPLKRLKANKRNSETGKAKFISRIKESLKKVLIKACLVVHPAKMRASKSPVLRMRVGPLTRILSKRAADSWMRTENHPILRRT